MNRAPQQPFYSLNVVRALALEKKIRFKPRSDGKSNPAFIMIDEDEAVSIIAGLSLRDFKCTDELEGKAPADVYMTSYKRPESGVRFNIYINLAVRKDGKLLLIISFHK